MKRLTLLLLTLVLILPLSAIMVNQNKAQKVAQTWYNAKAPLGLKGSSIENTRTLYYNKQASLHIIDFTNGGYVMVAADDIVEPIIAFGFENQIPKLIDRANYKFFIENYQKQIEYYAQNAEIDPEIENKWRMLSNGIVYNTRTENAVLPLLVTQWNQDAPYNLHCPEDAAGPGGHVYAGCVATAMGQVMRYWGSPLQGTGSHGYYPQGYDYQFADYGNTSYDMWEMPWSISTEEEEIARFLHHCGISVEMMYSPHGSGAYSHNVPAAMINYFGYSSATHMKDRRDYTDNQWLNLIKTELELGRPLYYSGSGDDGGHAFVLDGYRDDNYMHFDFGWSGNGNGYYSLAAIHGEGGEGFNDWQDAIFDAVPNNFEPNVGVLVYEPNIGDVDSSGALIAGWLTNNGYNVNYTDVFPFNLKGYESVFIAIPNKSLDDANYFKLNPSQALVVNKYLKTGGNVYIEGSSIFSSTQLDKSLFGVSSISEGTIHQTASVNGNSFSIANSINFGGINNQTRQVVNLLNPSMVGSVLFEEANYGVVGMQAMGYSNQKTVCSLYNISNFTTDNQSEFIDTFLTRVLGFFEGNNKPENEVSFDFTTDIVNLNLNLNYGGTTPISGYRIYIDDEKYADIEASGNISYTVSGIEPGYHTVKVSAGNMYGETELTTNHAFFISGTEFSTISIDDGTCEAGFAAQNGDLAYVKFYADGAKLLTHAKIYIEEVGTRQVLIRAYKSSETGLGEMIAQKVYSNSLTNAGWNIIPLANEGILLQDEHFYISVLSFNGSSVIGVDSSSHTSSFTATIGSSLSPYNEGEFMFRALVKTVTNAEDNNNVSAIKGSISNYPNPFNPATTISLNIPVKGNANLSVYNVKGQKVRTLLNGYVDKGQKQVSFNGKDDKGNSLASGIYFYKFNSSRYSAAKKMILLK